MALTLRRRAAPESFLESIPRGEECAASKISDSAPWRCFEALSGIRSRSPSARHSSANSARHLRATLLPANYSEPPHELLLPAHQQDPATWQLELLSAIGAPASAQVFSARICPRLVVFWAIAPSSVEINERAGRLARISHIYGDALAVECDSNDSAFNECDKSETAQCKHIAAATAAASTRAKSSPPYPPASSSSLPLPRSPQTLPPSSSSCRRSASLPALAHPPPPLLSPLPHHNAPHPIRQGHALFDPPSTPSLEPPSSPSKLDPPSPLSIETCHQLTTPTNLPSPPSLEASLKPSALHPSPPLSFAPFIKLSSLHPPPPPALCLASLLPYDVAERIFLALSFADLISCAAVCKAWRCHVSSNQVSATCPGLTHSSFLAVVRAAEAGNLDACVIMARVMEARGEQQRALEWYRKAARMGHQGSQYRMGEAYYRGDGDWLRDEEEALAWLLRAARNAQADPVLGAAAALLLGYMYLDGEGTGKPSTEEAIRCIAEHHPSGVMAEGCILLPVGVLD
ncbi:unnamed protein product [Closterium sp. Naga37s-1]|nr:unnamed protein product [Closterium sp. Naga37s-1]